MLAKTAGATNNILFDTDLMKKLYSKERVVFAEKGYHSLNIQFPPADKEQLDNFMKQIAKLKRSAVRYHSRHTGYLVNKYQIERLLPLALRSAIVPLDVIHSLQYYFGDSASPILFAMEVHEVKVGAPVQTCHADITADKDNNEDISRLVVTCILSTRGPVTTFVYPNTRASKEAEDELVHIPCIRATEHNNCLLLDAAMAHKGSANNSGEDDLRIILTFIRASTSRERIGWLRKCLGVQTPLNLSVAEFLGESSAMPMAAGPSGVMQRKIPGHECGRSDPFDVRKEQQRSAAHASYRQAI